MEYRENPMFGRRVFFLNPPMSIENYVIENLKKNDYEVYDILDYTCAKAVLRHHENAICFVFIDDVLPLDGWYNFIKSFENDESLKSIFFGVLSVKTKPKDQERFLMSLKLPGGFVMLDKNVEEVYTQIEGILKINGARGVRKCIRLDLRDSNDVNGYFAYGSQLYSFRLVDISALGFAAIAPMKMAGVFKKGSVIPNISITMGRYSFVCTGVCYNTKIVGDQCTVVMLLSNETPKEVRTKIHDFIYESLELQHKILLENALRDMTDYTVRRTISDNEAPEELVEELDSEVEKEDSNNSEQKEGSSDVKENTESEKDEQAQEAEISDADKSDAGVEETSNAEASEESKESPKTE